MQFGCCPAGFRASRRRVFHGRTGGGDPEETLTFSAAVTAELSSPGTRPHTKTACAKRWVREFLKGGPQPSQEIYAASREVGLTETPLASALRAVAIKSKQGQSGPWVWELGENDRKSRD